MKSSPFSWFIALLLTLHCIGATQLMSAYASDKSSFVRMLAMAEEETKKEKDCNCDDDADPEFKYRHKTDYGSAIQGKVIYLYTHHRENVFQEFINELATPPPDFRS